LFSESRQCRKPNLNIDNLKETLFNIYNDSDNELLKNKIDLSKPEQIKNDLCDFNEDLKNKPPEYFYPFLKNPKTANDIYKKCQSKGNCYLGVLFTGTNDSAFQTKYITFISNKYARK
jgi:hypothetical protein